MPPLTPQRVAWITLAAGLLITALKFIVFAVTNSAAVLTDAVESILNVLAAGMAVVSTWYASRPPDRLHPYGHGNIEFVAVGVEGTLIVLAGASIAVESLRRLIRGATLGDLDLGTWLLVGVTVLVAALAVFVLHMGRRLGSPTLRADGRHLMTDVLTTLGTLAGLIIVRFTGLVWLDAAIALLLVAVVVYTGASLLRESWRGILDTIDTEDDRLIRSILDKHLNAGEIRGYHKLRHRHVGTFHWIDVHIQMPATMNVRDAHAIISGIEHEIEQTVGNANATVHIEPDDQLRDRTSRPSAVY